MYLSKLKIFAFYLSLCLVVFVVMSCKKDEASTTEADEIPATSTAETRLRLSAQSWQVIQFRPPVFHLIKEQDMSRTYIYTFVDSIGEFLYTQIPGITNYRAGIYSISGNKITPDYRGYVNRGYANAFLPSGCPLYVLFKDSLMYINDRPTIAPTDFLNYATADIPMITFKKR